MSFRRVTKQRMEKINTWKTNIPVRTDKIFQLICWSFCSLSYNRFRRILINQSMVTVKAFSR